MTGMPAEPTLHRFAREDGTRLAWHALGPADGRPLVLIHGLFSNAQTNWVKFGHARLLAEAGHRVLMPDLRAHGRSGAPHADGAYPPDVLAEDGLALVAHLGLADRCWDLAGYSLGGRTALRMLIRGARPRRAVIAGMGLDGLLDPERRAAYFRTVVDRLGDHPRGSPEYFAEAFLRSTGGDPQAMRPLLGSFVPSSRAELARIELPVLVLSGAEDQDNGSAKALADALPQGDFVEIAGNHMSAVANPALGREIAKFLA